MEYEIKDDPNGPPSPRHRSSKYGFDRLKVGQRMDGLPNLALPAARNYARRHGLKIVTRKQPDGTYTVWRLK
jgi:hypothetical protein